MFTKSVLAYCFTALLAATAAAQAPISTGWLGNTAIGGSDTVAYHDMYAAGVHEHSQGEPAYTFTWHGAVWRFASAASRDRFAAAPETYAPPYGGHCANALSLGEGLIPTDGSIWEFFDDNLYLFYAERGRQRWLNGDWRQYKASADLAWKTETETHQD